MMPLVLHKIREERETLLLEAPKWPNQPFVPGADGEDYRPVADSSVERSPVSSEGLSVAPQTRSLVPACLAGQRERRELRVSRRVLDTIDEARALSTRHLYNLKWRVFVSWCKMIDEDCI